MRLDKESELLNTAKDFFNKNQLKDALELLEDVISLNPSNSEAYFLSGNIMHIKGQLGKAIKAFKKTLELDPAHTDAAISLSVIYNDIGKYEEAKAIFDKADKRVKQEKTGVSDAHLNKKFALKHFELAEMYYSYNRYDEALFEYNKTIALDPDDLATRIKVAKVYSKKGYISKAQEELRRLKTEYPNYIPARVALGLLYYGNGNILEAQTEWQNALAKDPMNDELQMYMNLSKGATETRL